MRNGTANLFMISEPLAGWRHVMVTERRTAKDFAEVLRWLAEDVYKEAEKVILVMDNLSTHKLASLYEAFGPEQGAADRRADRGSPHPEARELAERGRDRVERSEPAVPGPADRVGGRTAQAVGTGEVERNDRAVGVKWQFTTGLTPASTPSLLSPQSKKAALH